MHRLLSVAAVAVLTVMAVCAPSGTVVAKDASEYQYKDFIIKKNSIPIPIAAPTPIFEKD